MQEPALQFWPEWNTVVLSVHLIFKYWLNQNTANHHLRNYTKLNSRKPSSESRKSNSPKSEKSEKSGQSPTSATSGRQNGRQPIDYRHGNTCTSRCNSSSDSESGELSFRMIFKLITWCSENFDNSNFLVTRIWFENLVKWRLRFDCWRSIIVTFERTNSK